jgi:outer membrane lipoprotein-sorting protein
MNRRAFLAAMLVSPYAMAETLDDVLAKVARARAGLKTLVGPFTQTRKIGLLASQVRSTGTVYLVRPDRLRWELAPPDEVIYWVTPEGLAYKSKSGQGRVQGMSAKIASALEDVRTLLGGDLGTLKARYEMTLVPTSDGSVAFDALPKDKGRFQRFSFALASDLVTPVRATMVESAKDKTDIVFGALQRDVAIDPAKMRPPT